MNKNIYFTVSSFVFGVVAGAHLLRLVFLWPAYVNGVQVPLAISFFAALISGILSYNGCKLSKKK